MTSESNVWDIALKLLKARALTCQELKIKLLNRDFPESDVGEVLIKAKGYQFIDDLSLAKAVADKEIKKFRGPQRIKQLLTARGIDSEIIQRVLETLRLQETAVQIQLARKALQKKSKIGQDAKTPVAYNYLLSQGFSEEVVRDLLKVNTLDT